MPRTLANGRGLFLVVALGCTLIWGACGAGAPEPPGELLRSDKSRALTDDVPAADVGIQVSGNTGFALDLFHQLSVENEGNLFFSPHSIEVALALTWAGARGRTETAMAGCLHFGLAQDRLHPVFNYIDMQLASRGEGAKGSDGDGFRLKIVNQLFGQVGYEFVEEFLDVLAEHYGAGLRLLDFVADADGSAELINAWVEAVTEDRIRDLIPAGTLTENTKLVLVNAIYFNAAWEFEFEVDDTRDGDFATRDDRTVRVPMMHLTNYFPIYSAETFTALELPYDGEDLSMLVLLPDRGTYEAFEANLDGYQVEQIRDSLVIKSVQVSLPRWEVNGDTISLKELLSAMGMEIAFTWDADFSAMSTRTQLRIANVLHQAFVKVNEAGTEAAAATAVIMEDRGMPSDSIPFTANRPFIYLILDRPTGQVLFLGRVTDPS